MTGVERIAVAAGVIVAPDQRILIAQRGTGASHAGQWEFPGGKIEPGENAAQALRRELEEELGIVVNRSEPLITLDHDYPERRVRLYTRMVTGYTGSPQGREGQAVRWVAGQDLDSVDFLAANAAIVRAVQLPSHYLISDIARFGESHTIARLRQLAGRPPPPLFQLREKDLPRMRLETLARKLKAVCDDIGVRMLLNGDAALAAELALDGVHLPAAQLMRLDARPVGREYLLAVSCHDLDELAHAARIQADFAVLSPVCATTSHPAEIGIGWHGFERLCARARLPVYALGGMRLDDLAPARNHGAQGVATISAAWM